MAGVDVEEVTLARLLELAAMVGVSQLAKQLCDKHILLQRKPHVPSYHDLSIPHPTRHDLLGRLTTQDRQDVVVVFPWSGLSSRVTRRMVVGASAVVRLHVENSVLRHQVIVCVGGARDGGRS